MADPLRIHVGLPVGSEFHQVDAATRGIHFFIPQDIGWTDGKAESAVYALVDEFLRRWVMGIEGCGSGGCLRRIGHQMPPTKRPGFSVDFGSNCCFNARISGSASPGFPQEFSANVFADGR